MRERDMIEAGKLWLRSQAGPLPGCQGVGGPLPLTLCLLHVERGLLCPACYLEHSGEHPQGRVCNGCGSAPGAWFPQWTDTVSGLVLRPDGSEVPYEGRLIFFGASWCDACHEIDEVLHAARAA